jgi:hypothetical protein
MTTIVTRTGKGSPLTHVEVDTNFTNLNTAKLEAGAIALGSAGTPSISFTGDTNTGIFSPGADTLAFAEGGADAMRIDSSGRLLVGTSTANTSGAKLQTSDGLTFPATAVASADANTLDDYEEGTWTPTIIGSTTAGTATYVVQNARYTKTGRTVFVEALLNYSAGNGTGDLLISGLPFTSANSLTTPAIAATLFSGITLTAGHVLTTRVENANTRIGFNSYPSGGGAYATVAYDGEGVIGVAGSYTV